MQSRPLTPLALTMLLLVGACTTNRDEYPSLTRRPAERLTATFDAPIAPEVVVRPAPPAAVSGRLGGLVGAAQTADAKFRAREPRARSTVSAAAGAKMGSESWGTATIAVAELEAARSEAMLALTDLDRVYNETTIAGEDPGAISAARDRVLSLIARQDQVLGELRGRLGS